MLAIEYPKEMSWYDVCTHTMDKCWPPIKVHLSSKDAKKDGRKRERKCECVRVCVSESERDEGFYEQFSETIFKRKKNAMHM